MISELTSHALPPETQLQNGAFVLREEIGRGGSGFTYRALDVALQRDIAVKEFFPLGAQRIGTTVHVQNAIEYSILRAAFVEEARNLARFAHRNIVHVFGVWEENGTAYLVTEFLRGQTLRELVEGRKMLDENVALQLLAPIFAAVETVHKSGLLHGDIKPDNIFLCDLEDRNDAHANFGNANENKNANAQNGNFGNANAQNANAQNADFAKTNQNGNAKNLSATDEDANAGNGKFGSANVENAIVETAGVGNFASANAKNENFGRVVLLDFGLTRPAPSDAYLTTLLVPQNAHGTSGYAPLEQYSKAARTGTWSDVYALSATLWHLLSGEVPPDAPDRAAGTPLPAIRQINPTVSAQTEHVLGCGLAMDALARPQNVRELWNLLHETTAIPTNEIAPSSTRLDLPVAPHAFSRPSVNDENVVAMLIVMSLVLFLAFFIVMIQHF